MTSKQLKALKTLNKNDVRCDSIPTNEREAYGYLSAEEYSYHFRGQDEKGYYTFYSISEKGKAFLSDERKSNLNFFILVATFLLTFATFYISGGKQLLTELVNFF